VLITAKPAGGNWSSTATWDSGTLPTAADDVRLAATSGNVTIDVNSVCRSLDCTGYTGTLTHASAVTLSIGDGAGGALTFFAGMTYTPQAGSSSFSFVSTSDNGGAGWPLTFAGKALGSLSFNGAGGRWKLQDTPTSTFTGSGATTHSSITLTSGTLDLNGKGFTTGSFNGSGGTTRALIVGAPCTASVVYNGALPWTIANATNFTSPDLNNLTVALTNAAAQTFAGGGLSYGGLSRTVSGANGLTITGSNTFTTLDLESTVAQPVTLPAGGIQTAASLTLAGATGQVLSLVSSAPGTSTTILVKDGGPVLSNYSLSADVKLAGWIDAPTATQTRAAAAPTAKITSLPPAATSTRTAAAPSIDIVWPPVMTPLPARASFDMLPPVRAKGTSRADADVSPSRATATLEPR
jgi:hypothetical protein